MGVELIIAIASFVLTAAVTAYSIVQAKKMREEALKAADARKGFEVVTEGNAEYLPIVYGRALIGGTRTWHSTSGNFTYTTPNSDKSFLTGTAGYNQYSAIFRIWSALLGATQTASYVVGRQASGYLTANLVGGQNDFLFYQQALCAGPISNVHDVIIDNGRYLNDPTLGSYGVIEETANRDKYTGIKAALRLDYHFNGSKVDSICAANFGERSDAFFTGIAYLSAVFRLDRDNPQFSGTPGVQSLIEGRLVRWVSNGQLSTTASYKDDPTKYRYDNSPALCLLDYLLDTENGKGVSIDEIDLDSFEKADAICRTIVQENVTVGGKFWRSTDGLFNITSRNIPLYECNLIIDTSKAIRENIESILSSMGDARLVWSGGKYRLSLQYPNTNEDLVVAGTITDDDLVLGESIDITWPDAQSKYNHVQVRFHNENEGFKEDSVSWPSKYNTSYFRGIGGKRYPLGVGGWKDSESGGRHLNKYGVWSGSGTTAAHLEWLLPVESSEAGNYSLYFAGDDNMTITMTDVNTGLTIATGSAGYVDLQSRFVTLGSQTGRKLYKIAVSVTNTSTGKDQDFYGVSVSIESSNKILFTSRDIAYDDFAQVSETDTIYQAMLEEDNGLSLETDIFAEAITDPQHALAKAEEICRTSRSATGYKFKYVIRDRYYEPGDYIRLESQTLKVGVEVPVYLRVDSSKVSGDDQCTIEATRFDYTQLAWSIKDDVYITPPNPYGVGIPQPRDITYTPNLDSNVASSGILECSSVTFSELAGYVFYMHRAGIDATEANGAPVYNEVGRNSEPTFVMPAVDAASAFFGVRTLSTSGRMSAMTITDPTDAQDLSHNWIRSVSINAPSQFFVNNGSSVSPSAIQVSASISGFTSPSYQWYIDDAPVANATAATFIVAQFTDAPSKVISVSVKDGNELTSISARKQFQYVMSPETVISSIAAVDETLSNALDAARNDINTLITNTTQLQQDVSGNTSAISQEQLNRANADTALSQQISTVSSVAGDASARVETLETTLADPSGTIARATIRVETASDGSKRIVGMDIINQGETSDIIFTSDKFSIIDPDTGDPYFIASEAGVKMHNVEIDTLAAKSVAVNNVQLAAAAKTSFTYSSIPTNCYRNINQQVLGYTFYKEDSNSLLKIQAYGQVYNQDDLIMYADIYLDGDIVQRARYNMIFDNADSRAEGPLTAFVFLSGIAAGSHSVSFNVTSLEVEGPTIVREGVTLEVTELRQATIANASGTSEPVNQNNGSGTPGGSYGGGDGGGGYCVSHDTLILMSDDTQKTASAIQIGDYVKTQHHLNKEWGVFPVTHVEFAESEVYQANINGNILRGTQGHLVWMDNQWVRLECLGEPAGTTTIVKITVKGAQSYISNNILSHNTKALQP